MPPHPHRPPSLEWQVFYGSDAVRAGLLTEHQLRSQAWIRLLQNVYADARLPRDRKLMCQAAALRLPTGTLVAGPSAAALLGVENAASFCDPVHVIAPEEGRVSAQRQVRVRVTQLSPDDVQPGGDPPHTTPARTAWDVATWLPTIDAVAIVDTMLRGGFVTRRDLDQVLARHQRKRGSRQARLVFEIADGIPVDQFVSCLRTRLMLAGLPRPQLRYPLRYSSGVEVVAEMAWPEQRVTLELTMHATMLLTSRGWLVLYAPRGRIRRDFPAVLKEVRQALTRRGAHLEAWDAPP
ncbi:hypothetical protein [Rhizomonospora bruguierae]|uniref:hypothetical protein n=1 Tax=Rhizomonospora bruguierae TaxID=1581705 RepID=UPI001BD0B1E6|nr:hypothetical protein [Micromonospora sp. NBRC 107566]